MICKNFTGCWYADDDIGVGGMEAAVKKADVGGIRSVVGPKRTLWFRAAPGYVLFW